MRPAVDKKTRDRIYGVVLASACGNSLGGSCIGLSHKEILESLSVVGLKDFSGGVPRSYLPGHKPGSLLADSLLSLELAESIIESGGTLDRQDVKRRYAHLLEDGEFLGGSPGAACLAALRRFADGQAPLDCSSEEAVHDRGAARAYPLGCLPAGWDITALAVEQARFTQADSRVWAAAAVVANSVAAFVRGERLDGEEAVRAYVKREFEVAERIDARFSESWDDVAPDLDYVHPATDIPYSLVNIEPFVNEAVPTSVGIFLIFRHSLEEAICQAAAAGGDTDTAGFIVGALSGAYHGASAIPGRWLDKIAHRDRLEKVAEGLTRLWQQ